MIIINHYQPLLTTINSYSSTFAQVMSAQLRWVPAQLPSGRRGSFDPRGCPKRMKEVREIYGKTWWFYHEKW